MDDAHFKLAYTTIADAGGYFLDAALQVTNADVTVDHVTVRSSEDVGFGLNTTATFGPGSTALAVTDCAAAGYVAGASADSVPATDANLAGNDADLVYVNGDTLAFGSDVGLYVSYYGGAGALGAEGTSGAPIVFRPAGANSPGAWSGIGMFDATDDGLMLLDNVEIGYGGGYYLGGDVDLTDASPTISNTYIHDSEEYGINLQGDSSP